MAAKPVEKGRGGKSTRRSLIRRADNGAVPNGVHVSMPSRKRWAFVHPAADHGRPSLNPYDKRMELDSSWTKVAGKRIRVVYRKTRSVIHRDENAVNKLYTSS